MSEDRPEKKKKRLNRAEKKQLTREHILDSAKELFAKHGFEGSSVEQISENAGYSRGAFYANFKNKTELMKALISEGFDSDLEVIRKIHGTMEQNKLIIAYQESAKRFYSNENNLLWMLEFQLSIIRHPELKSSYAKEHRKLREAVQIVIEQYLQEQESNADENIELLADMYLILLSGMSIYKLIYGKEISEDRFSEIAKLLLRAR